MTQTSIIVTLLSFLLVSRPVLGTEHSAVTVDCEHPTDKWSTFVCNNEEPGSEPPLIQEMCHSKYTLTGKKKVEGLIVAFQGYSPCPDSFDGMAEAWLEAGYHVLVPLLVGHGMAPGDCAVNNSTRFQDITYCAGNDRIDRLPLTSEGYVEWVNTINDIVKEEVQKRDIKHVYASGLSHGGPLASYAVITGGGMYSKMLLFNAFFGISSSNADKIFNVCLEQDLSSGDCLALIAAGDESFAAGLQLATGSTAVQLPEDYDENSYAGLNVATRIALSNVGENFGYLDEGAFKSFVDQEVVSRGESCVKQGENGRGGICSFRLRNLFAVHAFSQLALRELGSASSIPCQTQFVATERDGTIANSLSVQAAQSFQRQGSDTSFCMYRAIPECM